MCNHCLFFIKFCRYRITKIGGGECHLQICSCVCREQVKKRKKKGGFSKGVQGERIKERRLWFTLALQRGKE